MHGTLTVFSNPILIASFLFLISVTVASGANYPNQLRKFCKDGTLPTQVANDLANKTLAEQTFQRCLHDPKCAPLYHQSLNPPRIEEVEYQQLVSYYTQSDVVALFQHSVCNHTDIEEALFSFALSFLVSKAREEPACTPQKRFRADSAQIPGTTVYFDSFAGSGKCTCDNDVLCTDSHPNDLSILAILYALLADLTALIIAWWLEQTRAKDQIVALGAGNSLITGAMKQ